MSTIIVIAKRSYVPFASDDDPVEPDNIGAIHLGLMGLQYENKNDFDRAAIAWGPNKDPYNPDTPSPRPSGAFDLLNEERRESEEAEVEVISVSRNYAAGSVLNIT